MMGLHYNFSLSKHSKKVEQELDGVQLFDCTTDALNLWMLVKKFRKKHTPAQSGIAQYGEYYVCNEGFC